MKEKVIHLFNPKDHDGACSPRGPGYTTYKTTKFHLFVTCKRCMKTKLWKETLEKIP